MTLQEILDNEELKKQFEEESGLSGQEEFEKEIKRLYSDWEKHHLDCKCLICA